MRWKYHSTQPFSVNMSLNIMHVKFRGRCSLCMPLIQFTLFRIFTAKFYRKIWRSTAEFVYFVCSDCHDDDADDGISLKSISNVVFVSAVLLKYPQAFMTKQIVRNPNISTNLKNLPTWEFLDRRQRHVWEKENEWWHSILTINVGNRVITSDLQKYIRNKLKSRSSQSSYATSMWNKMLTHVNSRAIVKHSMFFKQRSWIHDGMVMFLCPSADVYEYRLHSPNHEGLSLLESYAAFAVLMGK